MAEKLKVWAYNDVHNWGSRLAQAAASRGHDAHLFEDPRQPDQGFAFMHMHYHPQVRELHKRCMAVMAVNPAITLVPSYRMSVLYDDKAEQARQLSRWMPRTHIFWTPNGARNWLEKAGKYPFVSKAKEGSNVRLVETADAANQEVRMTFSDIGLKLRYGMVQRGYLLWQDFVESQCDYRILAIGSKRLMVKRDNKRPVTKESSRTITPVTDLTDKETELALAHADQFFDAEGIRWGAVDVMYDKVAGMFRVIETTVCWKMHLYEGARFITSGRMTDRTGADIWNVIVDEMEQGSF